MMKTKVDSTQLKNNETMDIYVILAPDAEGSGKLAPFLGHKGDPWLWHIKKAFNGDTPGLETRSYVGIVNGNYAGNITTIERNGVGILCHVFTSSEKRRLGIASKLMSAVVKDFNNRKGIALYLGTAFDSPEYWMYNSFGFQSMGDGSGSMELILDEDLHRNYFKSVAAKVETLRWEHWPSLTIIGASPDRYIKVQSIKLVGRLCYEEPFIEMMKKQEDGFALPVSVAVDDTGKAGACIGLSELAIFTPSPSKQYRLDIYQQPDFTNGALMLLNSLELPNGKILSFIEESSPSQSIEGQALLNAGFNIEGQLKKQIIRTGDKSLGITIYGLYV